MTRFIAPSSSGEQLIFLSLPDTCHHKNGTTTCSLAFCKFLLQFMLPQELKHVCFKKFKRCFLAHILLRWNCRREEYEIPQIHNLWSTALRFAKCSVCLWSFFLCQCSINKCFCQNHQHWMRNNTTSAFCNSFHSVTIQTAHSLKSTRSQYRRKGCPHRLNTCSVAPPAIRSHQTAKAQLETRHY